METSTRRVFLIIHYISHIVNWRMNTLQIYTQQSWDQVVEGQSAGSGSNPPPPSTTNKHAQNLFSLKMEKWRDQYLVLWSWWKLRSSVLQVHGLSQRSCKEEYKPRKWGAATRNNDLIQRPCYQQGSLCQDPTGNWTTWRPLTILKRCKLKWYGRVSHSSDLAKTTLQGTMKGGRRQTEEEVGRGHQGMYRPGVCQVQEGSGEQRKMEETGCDNFLDKSSGPQWPSWLTDRWRWRWWRCYKRMLKRLKVHSKRLHVHLKRSDGRNYCTVIILQKQNLHILRLNCPDPNQVKTRGYKILMPFCTYFMYSLILLARNHAWTVTAARYSFSLCASDSLGKKRK